MYSITTTRETVAKLIACSQPGTLLHVPVHV